jgi:O-antigen/teichoic acid export membrane protein
METGTELSAVGEAKQGDAGGGPRLLRNSLLTLGGAVGPALVGLLTIPYIVTGLGKDAFGVMALVWIVISVFALLDFGTGRAVTKFVAEYHARGREERIPSLFWTALGINGLIGIVSGATLALLAGPVTSRLLSVPAELQLDAVRCFRILALFLPVFVMTVVLRGALEGVQRFDLTNAVQLPANSLNFLTPAIVVYFGGGLSSVILWLCLSRVLAAPALLWLCLRQFPALRKRPRLDPEHAGIMVRFGGWLTVSNLVGPVLLHLDRVLIGSLIGMQAVALYAAPYEMITRLTLIPASVMLAFFPVFSSHAGMSGGKLGEMYRRSVKHLFLVMAPLCLAFVVLAGNILDLWLGAEFAAQSTLPMQILAGGLLILSLGSVPFNLLQAGGRPDVAAKIHLIELPIYAVVAVLLVREFGIVGAAMAWTFRAVLDAVLFHAAARRLLPIGGLRPARRPRPAAVALLAMTAAVVLGSLLVLGGFPVAQFVAVALCGVGYAALVWLFVLDPGEKTAARQAFDGLALTRHR